MNKQNSTIMKLAETALLATLLCYVSLHLQIKDSGTVWNATSSFHRKYLLRAWSSASWRLVRRSCWFYWNDYRRPYGSGLYYRSTQDFCPELCIGLITGLVAHKIAKINETNDKKYVFKWSLIASIAGLAFNVIADPIVGYFYKQYILGQPRK